MVALDINNVSLALAVAGGYIISIGLVSYLLKERLFMCKSLSPSLSLPPLRSSFESLAAVDHAD
jgi:hypothetical protein